MFTGTRRITRAGQLEQLGATVTGGKTCPIAPRGSGTYVKNDVTEVTVFSHLVEGRQGGGLVGLVDELERRLLDAVLLALDVLHHVHVVVLVFGLGTRVQFRHRDRAVRCYRAVAWKIVRVNIGLDAGMAV